MTSYDMETLDSLIKIWAFSKHENFKADKANILVAINSRPLQDLAVDIQSYQARCFEEQQRQQQQHRKAVECFDGRKKRHSLGF